MKAQVAPKCRNGLASDIIIMQNPSLSFTPPPIPVPNSERKIYIPIHPRGDKDEKHVVLDMIKPIPIGKQAMRIQQKKAEKSHLQKKQQIESLIKKEEISQIIRRAYELVSFPVVPVKSSGDVIKNN